MGKIFLSPDKSRLRAGWRLMAQLAVFLTFPAALGALWGIGRRLLKLGFPPGLAEAEALTALAMTGAVLIARKWLDKRSFASLGLQLDRRAGVELLAGYRQLPVPGRARA